MKAVEPRCQGVVQWPGFRVIQEDRYDGGIVDPELGPSGDMLMSAQKFPEGLHDEGRKGSASVYLWF